MKENFKTIQEHPDYQVSNLGRVYKTKTDRYLKVTKANNGYCYVTLDRKLTALHRVVICTFTNNPLKNNLVAMHLDNNPKNNTLDNLKLATQAENIKHKCFQNMQAKGSENGASKLTEEIVKQIKDRYQEVKSSRKLAKEFGIEKTAILRIMNGITWKHVK